MNACSRCAEMPAPACAATTCALVYAPAPPAFGKVRRAAVGAGYRVGSPADAVLLVDGPSGNWSALLLGLETVLSSVEAQETRIAPIGGLPPAGFEVALAALKAAPLPMLLAELHDAWLPRAIERHALSSHFQPIVDVESRQVFAHEALLRATDEDGAQISGSAIVAAGRRLGALHVLDQLGRTSAIRRAHALDMGTPLFINFIPTVVYDPMHCLRTTRQVMRETGMMPEQIVFEVVESEQIADRDHLLNILAHFRAEGFRVALDDLGSGYSSLNLLAALRPDFVKLDMELVRAIAADPLRRSIVVALVRMAQEHGIRVIAEGVETLESARALIDLGVRLFQGYLFGRPGPSLGTFPPDLADAIDSPALP